MATADSSTASRASVPSLDDLSFLADSYKALQLLAMSHDGHDSPVSLVLFQLNKQFEVYLDQADKAGLLS